MSAGSAESHPAGRGPRAAAAVAGIALLAVYAATAAPDVTFWDAGEFLTAFSTFGVPHPPGTPLFVALGRAWTLAGALLGADPAAVGNLLSAACTAAAGSCTAWLVARWTRSAACGVAAAIAAGAMSTAWANATEAEVYAAALLLACLALAAAERAGARPPGTAGGARATAATAYALALAVPLHLSALVGAPAVAWLASAPAGPGPRGATVLGSTLGRIRAVTRPAGDRLLTLLSAAALAAGAGTVRPGVALLGAAGLVGTLLRAGPARAARSRRPARAEPLAVLGAVALALSATLILLLRARHAPWLNQGDPSTWSRLAEVVGRRQYALAGLWPRQAPLWLQLANVGEWADWQVALGVSPGAEPGWRRTPVTLAFAALGIVGSLWHRRRDPRSWVAVLLLLGAGSVGVAVYLNLKAGPSFGWGVLPDAAPREARERDYFFVLAWWAWGIWAGLGCVAAARSAARAFDRRRSRTAIARGAGQGVARLAELGGVFAAALPLALNWSAATRARPPAARAAADYARALLQNLPARAVLVVNGDNDTYPLWFEQAVRGLRPDVTVVTASLIPAAWYRGELARRAALLPPADSAPWRGIDPTLAEIARRAATAGRPITASLPADDATRAALAGPAGAWVLRGLAVALDPNLAPSADAIVLSPEVAVLVGTRRGDRAALTAAAARAGRIPPAWLRDSTGDGVAAWAYRQLACPAAALAPVAPRHRATAGEPAEPRPNRLESPCGAR